VIDGIVQEIDARDTWTTYKVSLRTGKIIWQLGGKDSSFAIKAAPGQVLDSAGEAFAWQHDPEAVGHDTYTFFDNESSGPPRAAVQPGHHRPAERAGQDRYPHRL
jgi:hypothetical protein